MAAAAAVTGATTAAAATVQDDRAAAGSERMAALFEVVDAWLNSTNANLGFERSFNLYNPAHKATPQTIKRMQYSALEDVLQKAGSPEEKATLAARIWNVLAPDRISPKMTRLLISCCKTDSLSSTLDRVNSKLYIPRKKFSILIEVVKMYPTDEHIDYLLKELDAARLEGIDVTLCISDIAGPLLKTREKTQSATIIATKLLLPLAMNVQKINADELGQAITEVVRHCPYVDIATLGLATLQQQLSANKIEGIKDPRILLPIIMSVFDKDIIKRLAEIDKRLAPCCAIAQSVLDCTMDSPLTFKFRQEDYSPQAPSHRVFTYSQYFNLVDYFVYDLANFFIAKAMITRREEFLDLGLKAINAALNNMEIKWHFAEAAKSMLAIARAEMLLASISRTSPSAHTA